MALYSFRDVRRLWGVHMHSLWTRKDTWDLSPPSVENHPVTPSPPAPELKFTVKNRPCIRPCSHAVPTNPWPQPGVGVGGGSPLTVWCCLEGSSLAMVITATFCNCCDSREQIGVEERASHELGIGRLVSYLSSAMAASFDLDQALGSHDPLCSRILHS